MRVGAFALLLLGSCTLVSDLDYRKCDTDSDCADGGTCSANNFCILPVEGTLQCDATNSCDDGEVCVNGQCVAEEVARWGCVADLPAEPITGSEAVTLRMRVQKRNGKETAPVSTAVTAVACKQSSCEEALGPFAVDSTGAVDVVVERGFVGFVKLTAEGLRDTLYQLQSPVNVDRSAPLDVVMLGDADVTDLSKAAGVEVDATTGAVVLFQILNCIAERSDDVSVVVVGQVPSIDIFYLAPDQTALRGATATSAAGVALATDAPTGTAQFRLVRESSGKAIDSLEVATSAGTVTYVSYEFGQ